MADIAMPRLSDSMEEGAILRWLKSDGDAVRRGEALVEIETDKANMTYEADSDGVLEIVAKEGATLPVGDTIARLGAVGERTATPSAEGAGEADERSGGRRAERPGPALAPAASGGADGNGDGRVKASPVARRMAREMGVELAALHGTGPGGRIVKADVEAAARGDGAPAEAPEAAPVRGTAEPAAAEAAPVRGTAAAEAAPAAQEIAPAVASGGDGEQGRGETETRELTRLQRTVARRMAESKATAPDFVLTAEVDMEETVDLRKQLEVAAGEHPAPSLNDFVVKASALALRDFPRANAAYRDGRFELYSRVNVGLAVAGMDALVVPTVFDADRKSLGQVARETRALAERVRAGKITPPELSGGTFTVSNLGMYGIRRFVAVINPPQAAILAVGELLPRPVVRDGEVQVRHVMELTLACDHRILYGADAARFLVRIREYLEQPLRLAL